MTRRDRDAAPSAGSRDVLAPLASVTLARLYLGQRQHDRARELLDAVLRRDPTDLSARVLARRLGPTPAKLSLIHEGDRILARGVVAAEVLASAPLEVHVSVFEAGTAATRETRRDLGRSAPGEREQDPSREPVDLAGASTFSARVHVDEGALRAARSTPLVATRERVSFEIPFAAPAIDGPSSIVACLRAVRPPSAPAGADEAATRRILAVAPVLHL